MRQFSIPAVPVIRQFTEPLVPEYFRNGEERVQRIPEFVRNLPQVFRSPGNNGRNAVFIPRNYG